jgi:hypothetical protein
MVQVVQLLLSEHEIMSSHSNISYQQKKKKRIEYKKESMSGEI